MSAPLLIVSDVHLSRNYGQESSDALALLVKSHPSCEVVLAGDIFDLTLDDAGLDPAESIEAALAPHLGLTQALRRHLRAGRRIHFIPGNHDGTLATPKAVERLSKILQAENDRQFRLHPWFFRHGALHIEHGHLYDPDCAPNHPLADPNPTHEGLGNALMRRFIAPNEAYYFAHANQTTLSSGLLDSLRKWGPKAPFIIARYFAAAIELWKEAAFKKDVVEREKAIGNSRLKEYAALHRVDETSLETLLSQVPAPTHHRGSDVFFRLYFDRVFAMQAFIAGCGLLSMSAVSGAPSLSLAPPSVATVGVVLGGLGGGYLAQNVARSKNRYGNAVIGQLALGASQIRTTTDAELVVLGHSHVEVEEPGYINLGSFGYGRGRRPFLLVDGDSRPKKSHLTAERAS